jgi:hypothetical protein
MKQKIEVIISKGEVIINNKFKIFADWFVKNNYENNVGYYEASELLEIYKKEKL